MFKAGTSVMITKQSKLSTVKTYEKRTTTLYIILYLIKFLSAVPRYSFPIVKPLTAK